MELLKTFPTIMRISQEIKIMHLLQELNIAEIIEGKEVFKKILGDLGCSHMDNYVKDFDTKTVTEYEKFIEWLKLIKESIIHSGEYIDCFDIYIANFIDDFGLYYSHSDYPHLQELMELFTEEELEYICISELHSDNFNGKELIFIGLYNSDYFWVDENKIVHKILWELIDPKIHSYKVKEIESMDIKLIDYLQKINGVRRHCI